MSPTSDDYLSRHEKPGSRAPTILEALIPLLAMVVFLAVGYGWLGYRMEVMLICAAAVAGLMSRRIGYTWNAMLSGITEVFASSLPALLAMVSIGVLTASWTSAGTIPMLIYYGLKLLSPRFFLLTASLLCSAVSLCTGTSWGTIGTVGVALMGVAAGLSIPGGAAAGAIVAGAYFGDKLSPLSDQTNLAAGVIGVDIVEHIIWLLWTTGPAWLLGLAVYSIARWPGNNQAEPYSMGLELALASTFHFNLLLWLPPVVMLWFVVTKRPAVPGMLLASLIAVLLAWAIQGQPLSEVLEATVFGYHSRTGIGRFDALLSHGGMAPMMQVMLVLFIAFSYAGIMVRCGFFLRLVNVLAKPGCGRFRLIAATVASGIVTGMITGSSHLSIIVPGNLFASAYRAANLAPKNLSRTTEDSGTVLVPLIPWSAAGVFIAKTLGVATLSYLPWAIMNYSGFPIALLYGATGFAVAKLSSEAVNKNSGERPV